MKSEDLIQLIPNAFPDEMCDDLIQYHEWAEGNQLTHTGSVSSLHNPNPDAKPEVLEPKISIDCRYEVHGAPDNINFINAELIKHFQEYCNNKSLQVLIDHPLHRNFAQFDALLLNSFYQKRMKRNDPKQFFLSLLQ